MASAQAWTVVMETTKECSRCHRQLPFDKFSRHSIGRLGLRARCKSCVSEVDRPRRDRQAKLARKDREARRLRLASRTEKPCSVCGEVKPLDAFHLHKVAADGRRAKCVACVAVKSQSYNRDTVEYRRWRTLYSRYGITRPEYEAILQGQGGGCAICGADDPRGAGTYFAVDHCHETSAVRGLLCFPCNTAIGLLGDNARLVEQAAAYLERGGQSG